MLVNRGNLSTVTVGLIQFQAEIPRASVWGYIRALESLKMQKLRCSNEINDTHPVFLMSRNFACRRGFYVVFTSAFENRGAATT